jgi:hypothetical protein
LSVQGRRTWSLCRPNLDILRKIRKNEKNLISDQIIMDSARQLTYK